MSNFELGQVWESPRGFLYKVVKVSLAGQATLRLGSCGSGRITRRDVRDNINWLLREDAKKRGAL